MRIKLLTFKDGIAEVSIGKIYSEGANLKEETGIQIGKSDPIKSEEVDVPQDFFQKRHEYKIQNGKAVRLKGKVL